MATYNNIGTYICKRKIKKIVMENLDLIIFTIILVVLFIIFGIATLAEFSRMSNDKFDKDKDKGGVMNLKNFIGKILMGDSNK
jgi:hypothetical protein